MKDSVVVIRDSQWHNGSSGVHHLVVDVDVTVRDVGIVALIVVVAGVRGGRWIGVRNGVRSVLSPRWLGQQDDRRAVDVDQTAAVGERGGRIASRRTRGVAVVAGMDGWAARRAPAAHQTGPL